MRTAILTAGTPSEDIPPQAIVCHDVRDPEQRSQVLVRKGTPLTAADIAPLLERGVGELHLAIAADDDVGEDAAAARLGSAIAGPAVAVGEAKYGQASFTSLTRGVVRVDAARLNQVNEQDDVLLLTAEPDRPVDVGATLGVIKCAPLFLPERTLQAVESITNVHGRILQVTPFRSLRVGLVAPVGRLRGGAFDRARSALSDALDWYGSSLKTVVAAEASVAGLADGYAHLLSDEVELILAAGAAGTDPLDIVFEGLRHAGGSVEQIGIPAEPGTACWIGHLGAVPVLGLASCELFGQPGALDVLLPRILTGEPLDRALLRRIALGGLLLGPTRIAPYHNGAGSGSTD